MAASAPTCARHPAAPAIALCVGCGDALCSACTTRLQGRNVCDTCLARSLGGDAPSEQAPGWAAGVLLLLVPLGGVALVAAFGGLGWALHALG